MPAIRVTRTSGSVGPAVRVTRTNGSVPDPIKLSLSTSVPDNAVNEITFTATPTAGPAPTSYQWTATFEANHDGPVDILSTPSTGSTQIVSFPGSLTGGVLTVTAIAKSGVITSAPWSSTVYIPVTQFWSLPATGPWQPNRIGFI